ncbi:MAG: VanZ family protein [Sandaracinaceae bacterium]
MIARPSIPASEVALAWTPAVAFMGLIWMVSSFDLGEVRLSAFPFGDKGVHALEYGVLGFLVAHAASRTWPHRGLMRTMPFAVFVTVLFGLLDEIHQAFVPGRSSEVLDLVADSVGALGGALLAGGIRGARRLRLSRPSS